MTSNGDQAPRTGSEGIDSEAAAEGNTTTAPRARLTRLKINRFKNVKPGTELRFDDGINVLLGRNGTGKTTLLELITAVVKGDLRQYQQESFHITFELLLGGEALEISAKSEVHSHMGPGPFFGDPQGSSWDYHIEYSDRSGVSHIIEATRGVTRLLGPGDVNSSFQEAPLFDSSFYDRCIRLVLELNPMDYAGFRFQSHHLASNLLRLDEGLDVFRAITEEKPELASMGIPVRLRLFSGFPWTSPPESAHFILEIFLHYAPTSILELLLRAGDSAHTATNLSVSSREWDLLATLQTLMNAKEIQATLGLIERRQPAQGELVSIFGKPVFRITTHRGTTFTHDHLSYGEKRLLAFMYHAACNPQILVADELVNGLHHGWIQACLDAIQGQAFLTSQNPLLLDYLPFSSAEEVQRRFILCDRDEHGDWIWRNMDEDAAGAFYRAYKVGIQHVSEILETKGLW